MNTAAAINDFLRSNAVKPTTAAVASRIAFAAHQAAPTVSAIPPMVIVALIQALAQIVMGCVQEPEEAAAFLRMDDLKARPILRAIRRRRIDAAIGRSWKGPGVRLAEIRAAVNAEREQITGDVVAELYADVRA